jgi:3-deoxy-manno-octulosonate cytidylyltransferase (CMP-KDO synthetase)
LRYVVIPARFGSQRLPGKPLRVLAGRPLIAWALQGASKSKLKEEVLVATDDERVLEVVEGMGFRAIMTDKGLQSGTERVYEAIKGTDATEIVNLQADEPFIQGEMIDVLFSELDRGHRFVTLARPLRDEREFLDPNAVKVVLRRDGAALYFSRSPIPYMRTKKVPAYIHIGIYGFSREGLETFVGLKKGILEEAESLEQLRILEGGLEIKVLLTEYEGFGIDTEGDLERAKALLEGDRWKG